MQYQIVVENAVWDRFFGYYDHVAASHPNTWTQMDTLRQVARLRDIFAHFPKLCIWSRTPLRADWREQGYLETWQKGFPWHFAYTTVSDGDQMLFRVWQAEHESTIR